MRKFFNPVGVIILAIITAATYVYPIPVSILDKYGFLVFFAIFCAYIGFYIYEREKEINELKKSKPNIKVILKKDHDIGYLEIQNSGAEDKFVVQVYITSEDKNIPTNKRQYTGYWELPDHGEHEILNAHEAKLFIAKFVSNIPHGLKSLLFFSYDQQSEILKPENNGLDYFSSTGWMPNMVVNGKIREVLKSDYLLKVVISSKKGILNGAFIGEYKLNVDDISEIKTNRLASLKKKVPAT